MAEGYAIPPWVRGPQDIAGDWTRGVQLGSQIANERQRIQQQAATVQAELAQKQSLAQQEHQMELQRLEVEKSYHAQQLSQQQQELQQKQQVVNMKTQEAARQIQAQQGYQQWVNSGKDPVEGLLRFGPQMGEALSGYGGLAKDVQQGRKPAFVPSEMQVGGQQLIQTSPNRFQVIPPRDSKMSPLELFSRKNDVLQLENDKKDLERKLDKMENEYDLQKGLEQPGKYGESIIKRYEGMQGQATTLQKQIDALRDQYIKGNVQPPSVTEPPGEADQPAIEPGQVYKGYRFKGGNPSDKTNWEKVDEATGVKKN